MSNAIYEQHKDDEDSMIQFYNDSYLGRLFVLRLNERHRTNVAALASKAALSSKLSKIYPSSIEKAYDMVRGWDLDTITESIPSNASQEIFEIQIDQSN